MGKLDDVMDKVWKSVDTSQLKVATMSINTDGIDKFNGVVLGYIRSGFKKKFVMNAGKNLLSQNIKDRIFERSDEENSSMLDAAGKIISGAGGAGGVDLSKIMEILPNPEGILNNMSSESGLSSDQIKGLLLNQTPEIDQPKVEVPNVDTSDYDKILNMEDIDMSTAQGYTEPESLKEAYTTDIPPSNWNSLDVDNLDTEKLLDEMSSQYQLPSENSMGVNGVNLKPDLPPIEIGGIKVNLQDTSSLSNSSGVLDAMSSMNFDDLSDNLGKIIDGFMEKK